jgi:nitrogen regulatory protein P-II 1
MQEIRAYIKPFMLERVALRLMELPNFPGMSAMTVKGFGKERVMGQQEYDPFIEKVRLEIIATDDQVDQIVQAILNEAHSGRPGDGKVYVSPIARGFSIRHQQEESTS